MDLSSYEDDKIIISDYANGNLTFISPANATYPHGVCNTSQIPDFLNCESCSWVPWQWTACECNLAACFCDVPAIAHA